MRLRPILLAFTVILFDCAQLDPLTADTCGNGVVDPKEDCDTFPKDANARCGAPSAGAKSCRLLCGKQDDDVILTCPEGWGCSVSGFCRQPGGTFANASEPVSAGVTTMLVGDFDGDGRKDVLGSSGPNSKGRIHYFQDGAAPEVVALPGVLSSPLVYDFDGNSRSDIAFGYTFRGATEIQDGVLELNSASGFAIILGQSDRAVVTKLFPTLTAPKFDARLVPVVPSKGNQLPDGAGPTPSIAVATLDDKAGNRVTLLRSLDVDIADVAKGYFKVLPGNLDDLAGEPITARIFDGVSKSTCGELIVPFHIANGARVQIYSLCTRLGPGNVIWSKEDPKEIELPGETLTRVFAADLDNDGHVDIVIGTTLPGGKTKVRVAWGTGTDLGLEDAPSDLTDVPLAAGLLDADARLDLVIPGGVLISSRATIKAVGDGGVDLDGGGPPPILHGDLAWNNIPAPTKRWTVAQIADVNRDGVPDVIAASAYEPDIDVLEGTRTLVMPPFTIPTTGSVTNLAVGDFDFDQNDDIAFVQARPASPEREVAISYGRALTLPPEFPRPAGRLDGIRQVFVTASGLTITSATKGEQPNDLPTFSLAVLLSSGERQPVAPLLFSLEAAGVVPPTTRRELLTRSLVAAPTGDAVDLIALVSQTDYVRANGKRLTDPLYSVWVAPGTKQLAFAAPSPQFQLPSLPAVDRATDTFLVQLVSGDIDGDKKAEIVAISPDAAGTGAGMYIIHPGPQTGLPVSTPIPGRTAPGGVRSQLLDVDGDGNLDLVSILRNDAKQLEVNVFFGDGHAHLAIPGTVITLPIPAGGAAQDFTALGFTQITTAAGPLGTTGGRRRELVVITPRHLFRAFMKADRTTEISEATSPFGSINYGSAVVAGDFDGDGVEDLAIADQGSIRIARQTARLQ